MFGIKKYRKYNSLLKEKLFSYDFLDNEVPQGLCVIRDKIYITCYKTDNTNSCVIEYDKSGKELRRIDLQSKAHVGGIGYDKENKIIYICDINGTISSYSYPTFKKITNYEISNDEGSKLIENERPICSYLTYHNNTLYVGSFNLGKNGIVKKYNLNKNRLNYIGEFIVPNKVQGLTFYKDKMIISSSYGRRKNSYLLVFNYDENKKEYLKPNKKYKFPPMLEQIMEINNDLYLLFESSSNKYKSTCKYVVNELPIIDIDKIVN